MLLRHWHFPAAICAAVRKVGASTIVIPGVPTGADVAMESAGLTLLKGDLRGVVRAINLARADRAYVLENGQVGGRYRPGLSWEDVARPARDP